MPLPPPQRVLLLGTACRSSGVAAARRAGLTLGLTVALVLAAPAASAQRLLEFCRAALEGSPYLQMRVLEVDRARAERDIAGSRLLPQMSAQAGWSRNDYREQLAEDRRYEGRRVGLTARWSLVDLPSVHRRDASQVAAWQRELEVAQTRMTLIAQVVGVYLEVLQAGEETLALEAEREAVLRQVERLRSMRGRQMAKVTDLAEAEAYAQTLASRVIQWRQRRDKASGRLAELSGLPVIGPAPLAPLGRPEPDVTALQSDDQTVAQALRDHPRLAALARATEALRRTGAGARAEHLPQLALVGTHSYADTGYDNRRQPPYHVTSIGLELRVPLYEGGRVLASEREIAARLAMATHQEEAARREVEREIRAAATSARAGRARIIATAQEVAALEQTVRAQERGVELGVSTVVDLLDSRRRLVRAQADRAQARHDQLRDLVELQLARGVLDEGDVVGWDVWFAAPQTPGTR